MFFAPSTFSIGFFPAGFFGLGAGSVHVPDVEDTAQSAAVATLQSAGFTVAFASPANSESVLAGFVIAQTPAPNAVVEPGTTVTLIISLGSAYGQSKTVARRIFRIGQSAQ
jgi:beta-lactam-binding protein with PASTA domain